MSHYSGSVPDYEQGADWRDSAACGEEDPELFFPNGSSGPWELVIQEAKAVCRRCPVVEICLQWALETGQEAGVWGGLSEDERRAMKRRARRPRDLTAEAMTPASPRGNGPRTFQSIRDECTAPTDDGHILWTGKDGASLGGRGYTYRQIAFAADRGHLPTGRVQTECGVDRCAHPQHISDERERDAGALERLAAAEEAPAGTELVPLDSLPAEGCGSPSGALAHEACGEELCDSCTAAVTAAVGQLAGAGAGS